MDKKFTHYIEVYRDEYGESYSKITEIEELEAQLYFSRLIGYITIAIFKIKLK